MPQKPKPKKKPPLTPGQKALIRQQGQAIEQQKTGTQVRGTAVPKAKATATDRARAAGSPGGLMVAAKREKARRRGLAARNDAHVQEYYRWKNRQR
jgi:hypothetical protein